MKQEEKDLLLKDLCARLPYHVIVEYRGANVNLTQYARSVKIENCRPYLRPMSSMTEEERKELSHYENPVQRTDFYYSHHIDCRFMIEKDLAIKAPEEMYK